jgi:hypothetical protein
VVGKTRARLFLFRVSDGAPLATYSSGQRHSDFTLSPDGRLLAVRLGEGQVEVRSALAVETPRATTFLGRFHNQVRVFLGMRWLTVKIDRTTHLVHWDQGRLVFSQVEGDIGDLGQELGRAGLGTKDVSFGVDKVPSFLAYDPKRFRMRVSGGLDVVVDAFGQVCLFERTGELVCMFFAFRKQIAAWMPDGTRHGPEALLGCAATPGAREKIGQALLAASKRAERNTVV